MNALKLTDRDGDTLRAEPVQYPDDTQAVYIDTDDAGVDLEYADVLALHAWLGERLAEHGPQDATRPGLSIGSLSVNVRPTCCNGEDSSPCCPGPAAASVLEEAQAAIYGAREDDYGTPRDNWTRTAMLWTGLLQHKLAEGEFITPEDGLRCMVAVKLARDVHQSKRDNRVDGAGYLALLDRLETGR